MTAQQRLLDYQRQYEDQSAALHRAHERLANLESELKECQRRGEIPSESLMQDLRDAEAWVDWHEHECDELKIQIEECEAYLAADELND